MTRISPIRPKHPCNDDFVTDFDTEQGPGFFPGAGGYFHGCSACTCPSSIVFFGTDFGVKDDWAKKVQGKGGESRSQPTLRSLRSLIDEVADATSVSQLASRCYLTNAILALARTTDTVKSNRDTYKAYTKPTHRRYLQKCGEAHRQWLRNQPPALVVLMGQKHITKYRDVWAKALPELFGRQGAWRGLKATHVSGNPTAEVKVQDDAQSTRVLWMYHPSAWAALAAHRPKIKDALEQEVTRLRDHRPESLRCEDGVVLVGSGP